MKHPIAMNNRMEMIAFLLCCVIISNMAASSFPPFKSHAIRGKMAAGICQKGKSIDACQNLISSWLDDINKEALQINILAADFAWRASIGRGEVLKMDEGIIIDKMRSQWRNSICAHTPEMDISQLDAFQRRQFYFLCRGITFSDKETEILSNVLNEMQTIYTGSKICIPKSDKNQSSSEVIISEYLKQMQAEIDLELSNDGNSFERMYFQTNEFFNKSDSSMISDAAVWKAAMLTDSNKNHDATVCLSGEPDLERLMTTARNESVLKWSWLVWRQAVGPPMKNLYVKMVDVKNKAAQRQGYSDVGQVWREELEIPDLRNLADRLYDDVKDLYSLLHGVTRYFLSNHYGSKSKTAKGYMEAHLTGNMWAQNWDNVLDIILPIPKEMNLDDVIKKTNWTSFDLVKRAEDFYTSMGLPAMTRKFWKYSYFGDDKNETNAETKCHGTAANMYLPGDYRMIYCAGLSLEDFYVIHHEMGHIQYYMSYDNNLPTIFKDGANTAFQESIGDAIMLGVMSPQHLQRLGLINDTLLYIKSKTANYTDDINFNDVLLLRQALSKIPQIPFGYIIDKYRWDIFSGKIKADDYNKAYWKYVMKYQGIEPPNGFHRSEIYFDAGAKFHIPDNTPYIRYFLSSFLQMQIFKGMCQWSLFGAVDPLRSLPMPLHRCDIYGSKKAGRKLREMMSKGSSIHWSENLKTLTGENEITSKAFLEYFAPIKKLLYKLIHKHNISVGWYY